MPSQPSYPAQVCFESEQLRTAYEELKASRKTEDKRLCKKLKAAINVLRQKPAAGDTVHDYQVPKEYRQKHGPGRRYLVYRLSDSMRLTYILSGKDGVRRVILVEWMTHGEYERRFGYRKT